MFPADLPPIHPITLPPPPSPSQPPKPDLLLILPPLFFVKTILPLLDPSARVCFSFTCKRYRYCKPAEPVKGMLNAAAIANHFEVFRWAWHHKAPFTFKETAAPVTTGFFDTLGALLSKHPPRISHNSEIQDRFCLHLCTRAAKVRDWKLLAWARRLHFPWDEHTFYAVAEAQNYEFLEQMHQQRCTWDPAIFTLAAKRGDMQMLQWAVGTKNWGTDCICQAAASVGNLEVLIWARAQNFPWNARPYDSQVRETALEAIAGGHLDLLKWAHANGCPVGDWYNPIARAASYNQFEIVKWAREKGYSWPKLCKGNYSPDHFELEEMGVCGRAVFHRNWPMLKWALDNGCPYFEDLVNKISALDLETLKELYALGIPLKLLISEDTIKWGEYGKLEWAFAQGFTLDLKLTGVALATKDLTMIGFVSKGSAGNCTVS